MKDFETEKLYYGFPVVVLGYKDEQWGYNITTSTSSYSLADTIVIGLFCQHNATAQIRKYGTFTLNLPPEHLMAEVEQAGFVTHRDKLTMTKLDYEVSDEIDAPILLDSLLTLSCVVEQEVVFGNFVHFFAKIVNRKVADNLLTDDHLDYEKLSPYIYMGDGKERIYRQLTDSSTPLGGFMKAARQKKRAKQPILPALETKRLNLRPVEIADASAMFAYGSQERVADLAGFPPNQSIAEVESFIRDNLTKASTHRMYAITLKDSAQVIGAVDFHPHVSGEEDMVEMGYVLHPDYWGQGFGTEAAHAFIRYGFDQLGLRKIDLNICGDNQASLALAHKLGFTQEARLRAYLKKADGYHDRLVFGLLREEYAHDKDFGTS